MFDERLEEVDMRIMTILLENGLSASYVIEAVKGPLLIKSGQIVSK
jgi:hypothetical protein